MRDDAGALAQGSFPARDGHDMYKQVFDCGVSLPIDGGYVSR